MAENYENPHVLPPEQCSTNVPTWTDDPLNERDQLIRKTHIDELRSEINDELTRRNLNTETWTDSTITANVTKVRRIHIVELRNAVEKIQSGDCSSDVLYCPEDTVGSVSWGESISAGSTEVSKTHISEIRSQLASQMQTCICETEQCEYCADCGYHYTTCSHAGCACDDHKYSDCQYSLNHQWVCASVNLAVGTTHPYKEADGDPLSTSAWDGTVPWDMCNYAPPGLNWAACEYQGGHDHSSDWNCKCNPYNWST